LLAKVGEPEVLVDEVEAAVGEVEPVVAGEETVAEAVAFAPDG
jgi:hypothetical protein